MTDELLTRWFPSLDIPVALRPAMAAAGDVRYALISMLDSSPGVASFPSVARVLDSGSIVGIDVDGDLVVEAAALLDIVEHHDLMGGFDELWLCSAIPPSAKPEAMRITTDQPLVGEDRAGLREWMEAAGCRVGLGDGIGLNVATFDRRVVEVVEAL